LHLALLASVLAVAATALSIAPAHAHPMSHEVCYVARPGTWLYPAWCHRHHLRHHHRCRVAVRWGRAFRVDWQSGAYLWARNLEVSGWVYVWALSPAPQAYCRAAGI
jgi:hypothetical protein